MPASESKLRQYHLQNYKQVNSAVKQVNRALRSAIARNDTPAEDHLTNVLKMMVAVKAEARLAQILYVPDGFTEDQRREVLAKKSLFDRWTTTLDYAFRLKFSISPDKTIEDSLKHSNLSRYITVKRFLHDDLQDAIHLRNKLAHGQWFYPLNSEMNEVATHLKKAMLDETAQTSSLRNEALNAIGNIVSDLIQSRQLFQSRFDTHYSRIQKVQKKLRNADFPKWKQNIRTRHLRGLEKLRQEGGDTSLAV